MAIADMLKLKLVGVNATQDDVLSVLHQTGAVELSTSSDIDGFEKVVTNKSEIKNKKERLENALSIIAKQCKEAKADDGEKDGFAVSYAEFTAICSKESEIFDQVEEIKALNDEIASLKAEIISLRAESKYFEPYLQMKQQFSFFALTRKTICKLGTVERNALPKLLSALELIDYCNYEKVSEGENAVAVSVIYHESVVEEVERALSENAFIRCIHNGEFTAVGKVEELNGEIARKQSRIGQAKAKIVSFASSVRDFKILSDYYAVELEKMEGSDGFERSKSTFYLEAFVPAESKQKVIEALKPFEDKVYFEFKEIAEGEFSPTLMKNNKVVSNFEFVTNMYSVPQYKEFDPNAIMGFFFAVFLGFITADVIYGLLMIIGGIAFNARAKRKTGINKLANVIVMAGIPTVLFGLGFDSWLGLPLLRNLNLIQTPLLPDPVSNTSVLAGITVPTLLLICLGMGVVHIMASLCVVAYINFKKGKIIDGICDGLIWAVFLAGLILFVLCEIGTVQGLNNVAIGLLIGSVALGALTAGRNVKGFGKFTKGFGAVYGLINYMSDILSYARLYGLMLSGAKISEIFSQQLAVPMLKSPGGVGGVIFCVIIMLVGHLFNIAMGLLGAYIHDARLQYVEFFSHFYTGDGELFKPLGSKTQHLYLD